MNSPRTISLVFFLIVFYSITVHSQARYKLELIDVDKGKPLSTDIFANYNNYGSELACDSFLQHILLPTLQRNGYLAASIDSISKGPSTTIALIHTGPQFSWGQLKVDSTIGLELSGKQFGWDLLNGALINVEKLIDLKEKVLRFYENNGYPFASVRFDSSVFYDNKVNAILSLQKGPLYHIDSFVLNGSLRAQRNFLSQYLNIHKGSLYNQSVLDLLSKRIAQSGFMVESKPWDIALYGTGSALNLYLEPKRSSQISLLAGLMPSNNQLGGKLLLTGEADMQLKNSFGGGEMISLSWQQIQVKSPRLQIGFQKPYLLNTNAGLDFQFNLLKKDSIFLSINTRLGIQYAVSSQYTAKLFFQQFTSNLLNVDSSFVKSSKRLPGYLDFSNRQIGIEMHYHATDDIFNPRSGLEWDLRFAGGLRNVKRNNTILSLKQDQFGNPFNYASLYDTVRLNSSQFRVVGKADLYSKTGRQSTIRTGLKAGLIQSEKMLTNELFQVGGINTLRGFDEESIFASRYMIASIEYRYLIGPASYLFAFMDGANIERKSIDLKFNGNFLGVGMGLSFETRSGIFKLAYAVGKQPNVPINFRESKIHFGFVSLF